jgi:hypothetical protein
LVNILIVLYIHCCCFSDTFTITVCLIHSLSLFFWYIHYHYFFDIFTTTINLTPKIPCVFFPKLCNFWHSWRNHFLQNSNHKIFGWPRWTSTSKNYSPRWLACFLLFVLLCFGLVVLLVLSGVLATRGCVLFSSQWVNKIVNSFVPKKN